MAFESLFSRSKYVGLYRLAYENMISILFGDIHSVDVHFLLELL